VVLTSKRFYSISSGHTSTIYSLHSNFQQLLKSKPERA